METDGADAGLIGQARKLIGKLRDDLLELSARNPLIGTRFSERSNSLVRIVDEVPNLLLK